MRWLKAASLSLGLASCGPVAQEHVLSTNVSPTPQARCPCEAETGHAFAWYRGPVPISVPNARWLPATMEATRWWSERIGVEWTWPEEGPAIVVDWNATDVIPGAYAHADADVDSECALTGEGWVRIDPGVSDTTDALLIAHELGHTLGYAHETGSIMDPSYGEVHKFRLW